jgi:hypothetical protein
MYSYAQNQDDADLLGPIVNPVDITRSGLQQMSPNCARAFANANVTQTAFDALSSKKADSFSSAWSYAIYEAYLAPVNIPNNTRFSWSTGTVKDIKTRNPQLENTPFVLPSNTDRPFPIIGTTLIGPTAGAPYNSTYNNFTRIEITPLYVGEFRSLDVTYTYNDNSVHTETVGGAMETFAFPRVGAAPPAGIPAGETVALMNVPEPTAFLDLAFAAGASSYAPGSFATTSTTVPMVSVDFGLPMSYYSPSASDFYSGDWYFSDGGSYENIPLISFLQRRVKKIILFFNDITPLLPLDQWDVVTDPPTEDQVTDVLQAFFGVFPPASAFNARVYEYTRNQVYSREDYNRVIKALQVAQQRGTGIMTTQTLVTIENQWWGIPAGVVSEVTFCYLGRLREWENQLSPEMKSLLVPHENSSDLSKDINFGPFKSFPHYETTGGLIDAEKANVLADLTGWAVLQHEEDFRKILS